MQKPLKILVADDAVGVRESLMIAMSEAGLAPVAVSNGSEALDKLRQQRFDVLVTDIWMPQIDGLNLIKQLRDEQPDLRVFAMTGGGARMTIETASSLADVWGAEAVFVKPFDEKRLLAAILQTA